MKIIDVYMVEKNYREAYKVAKYTYELEPAYDVARDAYAQSAILVGDNETGSKILIERYGTDTPFDLAILQVYADTKQYQKIIDTYERRIIEKPDDIQSRVSLSVAYIKIGDRQSAIKTLQEAIAYDPSLKAIGEKWIGEIRAGKLPSN